MGSVISGLPSVEPRDDSRVRISAKVSFDGETAPLWFDVPAECAPVPGNSDAFALGVLLPAMRLGSDLRIEGPVSTKLLANLDELQTIYSMWFPEFSRIEISAESSGDGARGPLRALAFSGGVDSFHAVLTSPRPVDRLIYVDSLDTLLEDDALLARIRSSTRSAAAELGISLYEVATNVRDLISPYAEWYRHSHTMALASVAHAMTGTIGTLLIAGDQTYSDLRERGSHPMLPPRFGSDRLVVEPYGWGTHRVDKVATVASSPVAMGHLRVCWRNEGGAFNCGVCDKCVRTKTDLAANGALQRCLTLDGRLDLEALREVDMSTVWQVEYGRAALARARANGFAELADALGEALTRAQATLAARRVVLDMGTAARSDLVVPIVGEHRDLFYRLLSAHHGKWLVARVMRDLPGKFSRKVRRLFARSRR